MMASTNRSPEPTSPGIDLAGKKPAPAAAVWTLVGAVLAALWAVSLLTDTGRTIYAAVFFYLNFYAGVLVLVGLSLAVMIGLAATDRLMLSPRQRMWIQSAHRTLGIFAVMWLPIHILTKISDGHATVLGAIIPFLGGTVEGQSVAYIGMGPLSAYMMVGVLWTGLIRHKFIGVGKPWVWRAVHSIGYLAWVPAMLHGLFGGRPAKLWVLLSYLACVVGVALALMVRLSFVRSRRTQSGRLATTTMSTTGQAMRPVGKAVSVAAPRRRDSRRRYDDDEDARFDDGPYGEERFGSRSSGPRFEDTQFEAAPLDLSQPDPLAQPEPEPIEQRPTERVALTVRPVSARPVSAPIVEERAPRAGRRRAAERDDDIRSRPPKHSADDYAAEQYVAEQYMAEYVAERTAPEPPRRRPRSADEYLVTERPTRAGRRRAEARTPDLEAEPRRSRAERDRDREYDRVYDLEPERPSRSESRRAESRRAGARRADGWRDERDDRDYDDDIEPRYRATAPAPRYIPAPASADDDDDLFLTDPVPVDDTPTLVDLASRRAIRNATRDSDIDRDRDNARDAAVRSRRSARRRRPADRDSVDEDYWGYLRGEAR